MFEEYHKELLQSDRDPKTIERYWEVVTAYRQWRGDRAPDVASAKEYLAYLREKGYKPNSVILHYHALRLFFEFIGVPLKLKLRKPRLLPRYHDRGDFEALVKQAELGLYHQTPKCRERNVALILTFGYTGIRKGELLALTVGDLDFNRRFIFIRDGKNQKDRIVPMAERIVVPLRRQCEGKGAHDRIFEGLSDRNAYRIVNSLGKACGLENFHPHLLRHYCGTALVEAGVDVATIAKLLGHSDLNTTAIYLDIIPQHLLDAVGRLDSPRHPVLDANDHHS